MENKKYVPTKEWIAYCIAACGQGMVYGIMSSYISDYYLNVLALSPLFVLLLMFFARIWDAINDPIMGYIVDHANPKKGKIKAYLLYTPLPIAILTLLLFNAPGGLSPTKLMIYATITYVAWGMTYTACDVPFWSLPNALTPNAGERGSIISLGRTVNGVGAAIPMALFMLLGPLLAKNLSGSQLEQRKYTIISLICAIIGSLLIVLAYFKTKERVKLPVPAKKDKSQPNSLKLVFSCKPLMLTALMGILSAARYLFQAGAVHVARYSFFIGDEEKIKTLKGAALEEALQGNLSKVSLILALASAAGMFGAMVLTTPLIKKFSYKQIIIVSSLMGSASSLAMWVIGYNHFWACVACIFVSTIPCGTINVCAFAMTGDCLDYMEWKTGVRLTGLGSAIQSFVTKFGNAIATSAIIVMYMVVKLDVASISAKVTANPLDQTPLVRNGMFSIISLIPAISLAVCIIPMLFYNLTGETKEKMEKELAEQRAAKGIEIES